MREGRSCCGVCSGEEATSVSREIGGMVRLEFWGVGIRDQEVIMNWGLGKPGGTLSFLQRDAECMLGPGTMSSGLDRWGNGYGDPAVSFTNYNEEQRCRECTSMPLHA